MKDVFIYALKDPEGNIRYIGKTSNIKRRFNSHIRDAITRNSRTHVLNWIKSLKIKSKIPIIEIIEICPEDVWEIREKYWIDYYRQSINNLCNISNGGLGGSGPKNYSKEDLEKRAMSMSKTMSKFSETTKEDIWKLIRCGKSFKEINSIYSNYSRQIDFGIRNGRQWNRITGIIKTKGISRNKGYTFLKKSKLYVINRLINGKLKRKFSSKREQDVIDYVRKERE